MYYNGLEPFLSRSVSNLNVRTSEHVKLSFSIDSVQRNNTNSLKDLKKPIISIKARHNKSSALKVSAEEFGLLSNLYLCIGARVMLTRNLLIQRGLCNGEYGAL